MGLAWQQGPLAPGAIGRFVVPDPLPERLLYVEPLRRRMRVVFGGNWIADSEHVMLLHEPGRYPPKAILGTAYELATGERLASGDFEGGRSGAVAVRGKLGFTVQSRRPVDT